MKLFDFGILMVLGMLAWLGYAFYTGDTTTP